MCVLTVADGAVLVEPSTVLHNADVKSRADDVEGASDGKQLRERSFRVAIEGREFQRGDQSLLNTKATSVIRMETQ